jgi:hypothetical protein
LRKVLRIFVQYFFRSDDVSGKLSSRTVKAAEFHKRQEGFASVLDSAMPKPGVRGNIQLTVIVSTFLFFDCVTTSILYATVLKSDRRLCCAYRPCACSTALASSRETRVARITTLLYFLIPSKNVPWRGASTKRGLHYRVDERSTKCLAKDAAAIVLYFSFVLFAVDLCSAKVETCIRCAVEQPTCCCRTVTCNK